MEQEHQQYYLSQTLPYHSGSARAVGVGQGKIVSGYLDNKLRLYGPSKEDASKYEFVQEINFLESWIYCAKVRHDGTILVGCKDKNIYLLDEFGTPIQILEGHQGPVNCIQVLDENTIVSGSWDGTARVWNITENKCLRILEGHSHAVSVLALTHLDILVTGSQDKTLRFFELSTGKVKRTIKNAHDDIIRDMIIVEDVGFLSCSNDETVKLWTFDGESIATLRGHTAFVFTVACIGFGQYISGGDDKTLKIWSNDVCVQSIAHPNTIWQVGINDKKDIVTACADGYLRVFTTDLNRRASQVELDELAGQIEIANAQSQGMSEDEINKLPSVDQLKTIVGNSNGQIKVFRNGNKQEAYMWKIVEHTWELIGEVQGQQAPSKKQYEGDEYFPAGEYDYIFAVEDDSGYQKKLPFNDDDNPLVASEKYCAREGLSIELASQVRQFLMVNTKQGKQSKQKEQMEKEAIQNSLQQGFKQSSIVDFHSEYFPMRVYFEYMGINADACKNKLKELNEKLTAEGHAAALNEKDLRQVLRAVDVLGEKDSAYSLKLENQQIELISEKLFLWPNECKLPAVDIFRTFCSHFQVDLLFKGLDSGLQIVQKINGLMLSEIADPLRNLLLKSYCNLFRLDASRFGLVRNSDLLWNPLKRTIQNQNAGVRTTLANLFVNFSIDLNERSQNLKEDYLKPMVELIIQQAKVESNPDNLLKYLVALGNAAHGSMKICKPLIAKEINSNYHPQVTDDKIAGCLQDLLNFLSLKE